MRLRILLISVVLIIVNLLIFSNEIHSQQNGTIKGAVTDALSGEKLIGANIFLNGTTRGSATNLNGEFIISNIPPGEYKLTVSYLGYSNKEINITLESNKTLEVSVSLNYIVVKGEEVVVTGQAEAQMSAINQQLSARSIKNIVSAKKIQDIPDANAAESIGRLPGVSLIRSGGEGSKVVVRGLSPKFNKIQVEGVKMASTGSDDRSTDLSMISPYMLEGIELTKAALPDQEADAIGGSVNFILRVAPDNFHLDALAQSGYNGLKSKLGDYKFVLGGSNRFFDNKLGVFAQLNLENRNRSSYELNANYTNYTSPEDPAEVDVSMGNLLLKDIGRDIDRFGGTIVFDLLLPNGEIKLTNFLSSINKKTLNRFDNIRPFLVDRFYTFQDIDEELVVMNNSLKIENNYFGLKLSGGVSFAFSENKSPRRMTFQGYQPDAFDKSILRIEVPPDSIPNYLIDDISQAYLYDVTLAKTYTRESELAFDLNLEHTFNISNDIGVRLKAGGKYKNLNKNLIKKLNGCRYIGTVVNPHQESI